jgi:type I restriction enzyme M protein
MNMILHGIDAPNIVHTNTLGENIADIQDKDPFDVVLANPPFGGKERPEIQQNFPIRTGETAFLFLQHFIKSLKAGGPPPSSSRTRFFQTPTTPRWRCEAASGGLQPAHGAGHAGRHIPGRRRQDRGAVLREGRPTRKVWFYRCEPGRNLGRTNPLNDEDLKDFVALPAEFKDSDKSWTVDAKSIGPSTFNLSVKNPNKADEAELRDPKDIIVEMAALDAESAAILRKIEAML